MRLKLLTNLNTFLLLLVCIALGATLWWSQRALERPFNLMDRYLELSQGFERQVAQNIQAYLASGDALKQKAAQQGLDELAGELPQLPDSLSQLLGQSLDELRQFSGNQLLAAGKLAGDPQGLLLQAERDLLAALDQLGAYAEASQNPAAAGYRTPLLQASLHLTRLAHARAKLVESGNPALAEDIQRELETLRQLAGRIDALPLLGVLEQQASASDDFAAMMGLESQPTAQAQSEDRGVTLKRDLASVLRRFPDELDRTRQLIAQRQQLANATAQRLGAVQQALATLEPQVREERAKIQTQVRVIQGVLIALILATALLIDTLQRRLARVLGQLVPALSTWARGDFAQPIALATRTRDLLELQESLNRLRDFLGALDEVVGAIRTIASMAQRIAESSAQQSGAVSEIRSHSERIHQLGSENLRLIGQGRSQGEQLQELGGALHIAVRTFRV
ncbi:hypothetical protein [Pseudomonas sp. Pseusp97]|uniref:hypothetical protein n=1 Tax=Pseudomonas sp. Pseusp97 TaxID=3243065 RepID=UPI0039A47248